MGSVKGICTRIKQWFNESVGHDVHVFECLLHINELYLTHYIKFTEGMKYENLSQKSFHATITSLLKIHKSSPFFISFRSFTIYILQFIPYLECVFTFRHLSGDTKAPNKMQDGSVYNLIALLDPEDTKDIKEALPLVTVGERARKILDHALNLASKWKEEKKGDNEYYHCVFDNH